MDITLQTNDRDAILEFSTTGPYSSHSGFAARVRVRSGQFAGEAIVSSTPEQFRQFLADLVTMDAELTGSACFCSDYEDHHVDFTMQATGGVAVSGELFLYAELSQRLTFAFRTDQTCLAPLVRDLQSFANLPAV